MLLLRFEYLERIQICKTPNRTLLVPHVNEIANINRLRANNGLTPFALGSLSTLLLYSHNILAPETPGIMEAFAMLPSMRQIDIENDAQMTFDNWQSENVKSNVTELRFLSTALTRQYLLAIMKHVTSLERITYRVHAMNPGDDMGVLIRILNKFAKGSLRYIELGTVRRDYHHEILDIARSCCVTNLTDFDNLQNIQAEFEMFIYRKGDLEAWEVVRLVDCLPASVEVVDILDDGSMKPEISALFPDLFENITKSGLRRLPKLKQIIISRHCGYNPEWALPEWMEVSEELITQCEEAGIALTLGGRDCKFETFQAPPAE